MKHIVAALLLLMLPAGCGPRSPGPDPGVRVTDAWARATSGAAGAGAVYLTLESRTGDRVIGVSVPASVARFAQMHETVRTPGAGGVGELGMRHVGQVELPPGKRIAFAPGQRHIMLLELAHPLVAGDSFALALEFERARPETVRVPVRDE
jgi:copper(I)-binding protein